MPSHSPRCRLRFLSKNYSLLNTSIENVYIFWDASQPRFQLELQKVPDDAVVEVSVVLFDAFDVVAERVCRLDLHLGASYGLEEGMCEGGVDGDSPRAGELEHALQEMKLVVCYSREPTSEALSSRLANLANTLPRGLVEQQQLVLPGVPSSSKMTLS